MLRVNKCTSAAKNYYTKSLSHEDYYSQNQEITGQWGGKGALRLDLSGDVLHETFAALCENIDPRTGQKLTVRNKAKRRMGYDLTFSVPKSVSLMHAFSNDKRILDAFHEAVEETMQEIEKNAQTRVRKNNQYRNRTTGNLVYGKFTHLTSRPHKGVPDPQLHTHVFVLNATFDESEQRWKAIEIGQIHTDSPYYQAAFHTRVAQKLKALGYGIRATKEAFEIEGIPQEMIDEFSTRTKHIEKVAAEKGITNPKAKSRLGALTREAKRHDLSPEKLKELWQLRLSGFSAAQQKAFADTLCPPQEISDLPSGFDAESHAISLAIEHCFYHHSVVSEKKLLAAALRFSVGQTDVEKLYKMVSEDKRLLHYDHDGQATITTPEVLLQEEHLVGWVRQGLENHPPLAYGYTSQNPKMDDELCNAVRHILESRDCVTGVHGKPGTGKTTLMREAIPAIEAQGHHVTILAPTAQAARRTLRQSGFAHADTVERLLASPAMQQRASGGVLWVDEAGLLSVPAMKRLTDLAEQIEARIIFSGDTRQHGSVERGDALRILKEYAGLEMAELNTIRRQKNPFYREAINDFSEGRLLEGLQKFDDMGAIVEIPGEDRHAFLANEYINSINAGRSALVVSPTHAEGRKMTTLIRQGLKSDGKLTNEQEIPVLQKIDLTPAEKKDFSVYRPGWIVQMSKAAPGCRNGERMVIENIDSQGLFLRHANGETRQLDPTPFSERFEVYEHAMLEVGIGDHIRITRNGKSVDDRRRLNSGTIATITGFSSDGDLHLDTGEIVPRTYGHFTHGYVTTSHAAQSKTVQDIYVAQSSESFPASGQEQFYVSGSRGVDKIVVVTDDKENLFRVVQISRQRLSAMDIANKNDPRPAQPLDHEEELAQAQRRAERVGGFPTPIRSYFGQFRKVDKKMPVPARAPGLDLTP